MKLTRLRLHGFKSFVEPTDFVIEPGLTGVVGPNGCGKSNLVEALRWVMGETSHKSLRAADMDSVIFAGSGNRPARNHAEVAMTIDNADRSAPAAFNEFEHAGNLAPHRARAGSVYRINGKDVRARDVQILFADAATGARSPALVHQGKIGEIIQAKPEQRRRVLEDAAGVAGLHARRHEAELRLRPPKPISPASRTSSASSPARSTAEAQARQAIRYREVAAKVRKAEATLFHLRWLQAHADVAESGQTHDLSCANRPNAPSNRLKAAKHQAIRATELPGLREDEARAAAGLQRLTNARDLLDREEARAKERSPNSTAACRSSPPTSSASSASLSRMPMSRWSVCLPKTRCCGRDQARASKRAAASMSASRRPKRWLPPERTFSELTTALADLTARRNQFESNVRTIATAWRGSIRTSPPSKARCQAGAGNRRQFGDLDTLVAAME
jgi:chromosome segregation protein